MVALMTTPAAYKGDPLAGLPRERLERTAPWFSIPYLGFNSTWLQSGAGAIVGIAHGAMPLLSTLQTEQPPVADAHATSP